MALTKLKKNEQIDEISQLLQTSKLTVVATYQGTPVKAMQELRRLGQESETQVKVYKNRLVIKALHNLETFQQADVSALNGMLLYATNPNDEVAPAQTLANFAKTQPSLQFVGGFTADGAFIDADDVKALASLPNKDQLRGMLVGTIAAPLSGFVHVMASNVRGVLNILQARADALEA